jgi:hypothetical protein
MFGPREIWQPCSEVILFGQKFKPTEIEFFSAFLSKVYKNIQTSLAFIFINQNQQWQC